MAGLPLSPQILAAALPPGNEPHQPLPLKLRLSPTRTTVEGAISVGGSGWVPAKITGLSASDARNDVLLRLRPAIAQPTNPASAWLWRGGQAALGSPALKGSARGKLKVKSPLLSTVGCPRKLVSSSFRAEKPDKKSARGDA